MQFYDELLGHDPSDLYNSRGHRCKELSDLNLHNYILFAGDNVALGLDKPIEETYPYLVSQALKTDYYNLAIFNGGLDALKYNLISWSNTIASKPKAIVISSEFANSFIVADSSYVTWKACDYNDSNVKELFNAGNTNGFFDTRRILANKVLVKITNAPVYQIVFKDKVPVMTDNVTNINCENNHLAIATAVTDAIRKQLVKVRP